MKTFSENTESRRGRRAAVAALLAALGALALWSCTTDPGGRGGSESEGIRLTGRVVGAGDAPVPGVIVTAARSGLSDTTDALGRYALTDPDAEAAAGDAVLDTLDFVKSGLSLARVSVLQWIEELPDLQIIQRDISGELSVGSLTVDRIEFVLTGDGIDTAEPVTAEAYYNAQAGEYSGYVYFPPPTSVMNYEVTVSVYGPGDVLYGRSAAVPFNSFAGDVTVPAFSAGNARPIAKAGADTAVAVGATIMLRGTAVDSLGGSIVKWEWSIGGDPFVETSSGDTSFSRAVQGTYSGILRVTDNDGNTAVDTVVATALTHGTTWTSRNSGATVGTGVMMGVTWTGTQFVAVGAAAYTSPDGITWTERIIDSSENTGFTGIAWTGRKLIASGVFGRDSIYYMSDDGIVWVKGRFPEIVSMAPGGPMQVSVADTTLIAAPQNSSARFIARSEDHGLTWVVDTLPPAPQEDGPIAGLNAYTKHAGRIVGVGSNGRTASSSGNGAWTRHTSTGSFAPPPGGTYDHSMNAVVSAGGHAVAVGNAGSVMRSPDGTTWGQPRTAAGIPEQPAGSTLGQLLDVAWSGSVLFAVGNGYTLASADEGVNWVVVQSETGYMRSVAANGTRVVAVGNVRDRHLA